MRRISASIFLVALLLAMDGCNTSDQERAHAKAAEARQKTKQEARELTQEIKQDARALDQKVNQALKDHPVQSNGPDQAEEKLRHGGEQLRVAGSQAGVKLDRAALIARIKANLANDVGLSTVTGVDVQAVGQVVTLRGTVSSPEQKQQAEKAALRVDGVTKVIDKLTVQP